MSEIAKGEKIPKKMKRLAAVLNTVGNRLITTAVVTGSLSIPAFTSSWALPIGVGLSSITMLLSLATAASRRPSQSLAVKQEKHNSIKPLAQIILGSISDAISQTIRHENISPTEFLKIWKRKWKKYCKWKEDIRRQNKENVKEITKKQKEELFEQGHKKGREDFLQKLAEGSGIQDATVTLDRNDLAYKNYKIELKFPVPTRKVNNET